MENAENGTDHNKNNFRFLRVVALLSITDFAFSIDSITTAVAISDQYILITVSYTHLTLPTTYTV